MDSNYSNRVSLSLSTNSGLNFTQQKIMFWYYPDLKITEIRPPYGPISGGNRVLIVGDYFVNSPYLRCKFGFQVVTAHLITPKSAECFAPPVLYDGKLRK